MRPAEVVREQVRPAEVVREQVRTAEGTLVEVERGTPLEGQGQVRPAQEQVTLVWGVL